MGPNTAWRRPCCTLPRGQVRAFGKIDGENHRILAKFVMTLVGTLVLLGHMRNVSRMARLSVELTSSRAEVGILPTQLVVHAAGGLLVLLAATALSVFKPWGRTEYGQRKLSQRSE